MTLPFTLTAGERAMIADRLSLPDCIVQVFSDTPEGVTPEYSEEQIGEAIAKVSAAVERGVIYPDSLDDVDRSVLVEAIEGSTWAVGFCNGSAAKRGAVRVLLSAARKLIDAGIADAVDVPQR